MQQGGKHKWSDHSGGGSNIKQHRDQSGSDSDSCELCSSQLGADQENLLSKLLEDSAPDSTLRLGQDKKTWVAACQGSGLRSRLGSAGKICRLF